MMFLIIFVVTLIISLANSQNNTGNSQIKTKRTLNNQLYNYGENKPVVVYLNDLNNQPANHNNNNNDQQGFYTNTKTFPFASTPVKGIFGPGVPKVAAQQVLYEFQQTPTNAVSNVHVKQLFQPLPDGIQNYPPIETPSESTVSNENNPNQFSASETVVAPVQHSAYTNHGQNYAHVHYHPLYNIQPQHTQTHHYVPGKYIYVNGKIVYQPKNHQNHNQAYLQNQQKLPLLKYNNNYPQQTLSPPPPPPATSHSRFIPPQKHQIQSITHPMTTVHPPSHENTEEQKEEDDESNEPLQENEEDGDEKEVDDDNQNYREDDDDDRDDYDRNPVFGKYTFDGDEENNDERGSYRKNNDDEEIEEDDEEDDNKRGSSKYVSKTRNSPKKKSNKNKYSYSENYSTSSKYEYPEKGTKKKNNRKKQSKPSKSSSKKYSKPKIEGLHSEQIPVTHKHKIFKEKWYVTKTNSNE